MALAGRPFRPRALKKLHPGPFPRRAKPFRSSWCAGLAPEETGERIPVKTLRHTAKTTHPRVGIAPEHSAQLFGHEAASLEERVYLHHHGPSLVKAAAAYEHFVRQLLGDIPTHSANILSFG